MQATRPVCITDKTKWTFFTLTNVADEAKSWGLGRPVPLRTLIELLHPQTLYKPKGFSLVFSDSHFTSNTSIISVSADIQHVEKFDRQHATENRLPVNRSTE